MFLSQFVPGALALVEPLRLLCSFFFGASLCVCGVDWLCSKTVWCDNMILYSYDHSAAIDTRLCTARIALLILPHPQNNTTLPHCTVRALNEKRSRQFSHASPSVTVRVKTEATLTCSVCCAKEPQSWPTECY